MNEVKWLEFLAIPTVTNFPGYTLQAVSQLLQRKCGLRVQKIMIDNALDLKFCADPMIVQATPIHGIAFYKNMIFDANNESPKTATINTIDSYMELPCFVSKKKQKNAKLEPKAKQLNVLTYKFYRAPAKKNNQNKNVVTSKRNYEHINFRISLFEFDVTGKKGFLY